MVKKKTETEKGRFFGDQITNFTITKPNFPENTMAYVNQGSVTLVKSKLAIYLDYVILGQLIPTMNKPENVEEYECKPNETKLINPLYDVDSGKYISLEKCLAFFMVRSDQGEDKAKSKKLYLPLKNYCQTYSVIPVSKNIKTF